MVVYHTCCYWVHKSISSDRMGSRSPLWPSRILDGVRIDLFLGMAWHGHLGRPTSNLGVLWSIDILRHTRLPILAWRKMTVLTVCLIGQSFRRQQTIDRNGISMNQLLSLLPQNVPQNHYTDSRNWKMLHCMVSDACLTLWIVFIHHILTCRSLLLHQTIMKLKWPTCLRMIHGV